MMKCGRVENDKRNKKKSKNKNDEVFLNSMILEGLNN